MDFEAVIVRGLPWYDHVNLQVDPMYLFEYRGGQRSVSMHKEFVSAILPIREFPRYELARDFLPVVEDADERYLTVLQTHPRAMFGLVKFDRHDCADCRGSGEYRGLLMIEACRACQGAGRAAARATREEIDAAERIMIESCHWEDE